jgi:hypothetical protein
MGSKSDYLENRVLDHFLGATASSAPATVYVALYTTTVNDASTGTTPSPGVEVTGGSYARKDVTNNATNWPAASGGSKSNGTAITFVTATASWGTVVAFAILDALTNGNILYWGAVSPSKAVGSGDTAQFAIGAIVATED